MSAPSRASGSEDVGDAPDGPPSAWVCAQPLELERLARAVSSEAAGAILTFEGRIRRSDQAREVVSLTYEAHPDAEAVLAELVRRARRLPGVLGAASAHRTGTLRVGELAFAAAVAASHRKEGFLALSSLVEAVKAELPVWKLQVFGDGSQEWVNSP